MVKAAASDLSVAAQDYLKLVYTAGEWSDAPVTIGMLADRLGLSMSTVSEGVAKLVRQGLLSHAKYSNVSLTPTGRACALVMVRRHRILETFLVKTLGYAWDEVHDEAESLEHAVSDELITRIDQVLGHPAVDPHGDPIPTAEGRIDYPAADRLTAAGPGEPVMILRVSDADPELLRYFTGLGLFPGTILTADQPKPFTAGLTFHVTGGKNIVLTTQATDALWVCPATA
ncbi:metal-dependent transcriptional regulator [Pseudarthrobacter sp. NIBRBAC000502771]|uniref:metal-dependent transcriptional regulator n=1 Tax=Pseudarthrobacter sp. NIBRBAC000502771 TaxID=2590774 RepID=UPI001131EEDA|nr:metal-dependent transcriptional regulator [Pseudarthrobacter sp. NIBRBAC000502771]QDG61682.1 metal-dependent transcriptional regulator [Pseudarthrobacter sp. NIBRBAC000502771]